MNKKRKFSIKHRQRISEALKGHQCSPETRKKISIANTGNLYHPVIYTKELRKKLSESHKGQIAWNKGISRSKETKQKISEANRGTLAGDKNPNWKGGITPENKRIRQSIEYHLWRESVFARDNWTCQRCKKKGINLHAHHILNFSKYIKIRLAIDNGITLCKKCHYEFHKKYGRKNNNLKQLKEFFTDIDWIKKNI